mmetsp:Transcript_63314/g.187136  ORF Transcript_63314/g.187136 Transcript_63314/m.187136 type:complete len:89 (-) Transcript_63314:201-467(-)
MSGVPGESDAVELDEMSKFKEWSGIRVIQHYQVEHQFNETPVNCHSSWPVLDGGHLLVAEEGGRVGHGQVSRTRKELVICPCSVMGRG